MNKALFLDRDGTLIYDKGYLNNPEEVELLEGVAEPLRAFQNAGWKLFVVTNQSGIARGYITDMQLCDVHMRLKGLLAAEGVRLNGLAFCPHHPDDKCLCRKPNPGMILEIADKFDIHLSSSWMIGDKASDVQAGCRAGVTSVMVPWVKDVPYILVKILEIEQLREW